MRNLHTTILIIALALFACVLPAYCAEDKAACADTSACGGTCSTCPGKAKAMLAIAEDAKVVFSVTGLVSSEQAKALREKLGEVKGVSIAVADPEAGTVWVAYQTSQTKPEAISAKLTELGYKVTGTKDTVNALPALVAKHERCVVYVTGFGTGDYKTKIISGVQGLTGVDACALDAMFNMLIVNYDPAKVKPEAIKAKLVALGFAAGLPGGELQQPAKK
jgi:copper chaperone CopZ